MAHRLQRLFLLVGLATLAAARGVHGQGQPTASEIQAAIDANDGKRALSMAEKAIAANASSSELFRLRAIARRLLADFDGSIADASKAIELDPNNARAWNGRAISRGRKNDDRGALADVDRALAIDPTYHQGFDSRAAIKVKLNDPVGALPDANRAIELNGSNGVYWVRRGQIKRLLNDLAGADADLTHGLGLRPNDLSAFANRALVRSAQRRWDEAISDATQVLSNTPVDAATYLRVRADAYRARGMTAEAGRDEAALRQLSPTQQWDVGAERERARLMATRPTPSPAVPSRTAPTPAAPPAPAVGPAGARVSASKDAAPVASDTMFPRLDGLETLSLTPQIDPATLGQTTFGGQAASALEAMRVLMGPLTPEETRRFEKMWAQHVQNPSEETDAYFAKLNPMLQEMSSLRTAIGQAAFDMESAWQEAVMAVGYNSAPAAAEALTVAAGHARRVASLDQRMQAVAKSIAAEGPPPDPAAAQKAARERHRRATRDIQRLLLTLQPPPAVAAQPVAGEWRLVRVEKAIAPYVSPSSDWGGSEMAKVQAMGLTRVTKASFNASDGDLSSSATLETSSGRETDPKTGKSVVTSTVTSVQISWRPPPSTATQGTVWSPGVSISRSADGDFLLKKNIWFTVAGDGGAKAPANPKYGPDYYDDRIFPPPPGAPARITMRFEASGPSGKAVFNYVYETAPVGAARTASVEEVDIPEEYPAEGRIDELNAEIAFTEGSLTRLRSELDKETDAVRRLMLEDQILQAETAIQRDRDLIESMRTGQPVYTRTAWDERTSALFIQQVKDEVNRMAELQRNQATIIRMQQALMRMADRNPAEANAMKDFINRQLVGSGAAAKGDITKAREVAAALGGKILATYEGEAATNEEKAIMWEEYAHYAKTAQTMATTVVGAGLAEVGAVMMAPAWMARAGSAVYAGFTGLIETGSPLDAAKEAAGWTHPIAAIAVQTFNGYQEATRDTTRKGWDIVHDVSKGFVQGLAIGWLQHQATQLANANLTRYNYRFTPPKPTGSVPFTIKDFTESKQFRQDAEAGKSKVRAFEESQQELKAHANAGADPGTLKRLQDNVNAKANVILEDPHAKFFLLKSGQASLQTKRLFSLHHETTHLKIQKRFEEIMVRENGFNPQKHVPVRNATSDGTAGMDYDLALVEHPALVPDKSGRLVANRWLTQRGKPVSVAKYQDAASNAYRKAFKETTGGSADKAWEGPITSVHKEAYKDVGAARPSTADPNSFLHPDAGSGRFGGWLDTRNPDNVARLKKYWARQAGDVTEVKGWEFTNPQDLAHKGMTQLSGMHEAVRGTAKDVDKLLVLVSQSLNRAQGENARNLLAARNHWLRIQETMTDYTKGNIGPISFRHKLQQTTGRMTVNEVIADLGGSIEVLRQMPPG